MNLPTKQEWTEAGFNVPPDLCSNKPHYRLIAADHKRDNDSWAWITVIEYRGALETEGSTLTEDQQSEILRFVESDQCGIAIRSTGCGAPGQPFANEPWIQVFPHLLIVSQSGGLDI